MLARCLNAFLPALIGVLLIAGCSKKAAEAPAQSAATPPDTGATATACAPEAAAPAATPVIINNVNMADTKAAMKATDAAIRAKQYEDALKMILALQAQQLSDQQAAALHNQMVELQQNVANGVANGDPN